MKQKLGKKYSKAVIAIVIALAFTIPGSVFANFENINTMVSIDPPNQIIEKGDTFNISVYVMPSEPIIGVAFNYLYYNASLVHATSVVESDLFDNYVTFNSGNIDNNEGVITDVSLQSLPQDAVNESGSFVTIEFTALNEFGTSSLDLEEVTVKNMSNISLPLDVNDGKVAIGWYTTLNFIESSGKMDYVVFGEALDANDGGVDSYDAPKPPAPMMPYLRAWFDDDLPEPYNVLLEDYRRYPDTKKIWNLSVQWGSDSSNPMNVTISWDNSKFIGCEYNFLVLTRYNPFEDEWEFAADMLIEDNYVYSPRYFAMDWLKDRFKIIALFDVLPPEITNIMLTSSNPIDIEPSFGWENISCIIIDDGSGIDNVKVIVNYPDSHAEEYSMNHIHSTNIYYYNTTFSNPGCYNYHIWTSDVLNNNDTSESQIFDLPMNEDVNNNGYVHFMDLVAVVIRYGDTGPNGWIREDVDNNGYVHFMDLVAIVLRYGEYWDQC